MKALSIATLFALGAVGTACSQATETTAEAQPTDIVTVDSGDDAGGSFNLELPNDLDAATESSNGGFNLELPTSDATSTDGFNLDTDLGASSGLSDVPEIDTSLVEDEPEAPVDDEPVIRIE